MSDLGQVQQRSGNGSYRYAGHTGSIFSRKGTNEMHDYAETSAAIALNCHVDELSLTGLDPPQRRRTVMAQHGIATISKYGRHPTTTF